ncbi:cilia- and flagella-associated protein 43 [Carcharodon carcharias]|uniref:cilia- and flagella-associated protein 43 n=1 Tax=Carcharodon carcharias TaxID=13397 RepID=UPI001B7EC5A5|nr:cilia- and flagella-associated protein 43 [Carcharodon carcharias]
MLADRPWGIRKWVKGYTTQNVLFVNNNTICYPCGNYLIFVDIGTQEQKMLQCESGSIGAFTTNSTKKIVAFAEQRLKPSIYLYTFPELIKTAVLVDGAELDYTLLEISYTGSYFASFSSIPEFSLTIWNWKTSIRLCSESIIGIQPTVLSFNPMNQLQLCLASEECLLLWNIERCDDFHILKRINVKLPAEDGSVAAPEYVGLDPDISALTYYGPKMLISAQAGLVGNMANTFIPQELHKPVVQPVSVCWTPNSDLYVGCKKGHLLLVDAELHKAVVLATPTIEELPKDNMNDPSSSKIMMSVYPALNPCIVNTLAFHTKGLFTAGTDGTLYCIKVKPHGVEVEECWSAATPIRNITFSIDYESLLIATVEGSVHIYKPSQQGNVTTLLDIHSGDFVSACLLGTGKKYCVSARITGVVQVWSIVDGKMISTLSLAVKITDMVSCSSSNYVAVGTETGHIYYVNLVKVENPHLINQIYLHNMPVQCLKCDSGGQYLMAGYSDGHVFIVNAKPSKQFKVVGYTEVKGEIMGCSLAYHVSKKIVNCLTLACQAGDEKTHGATQLTKFDLAGELTSEQDSPILLQVPESPHWSDRPTIQMVTMTSPVEDRQESNQQPEEPQPPAPSTVDETAKCCTGPLSIPGTTGKEKNLSVVTFKATEGDSLRLHRALGPPEECGRCDPPSSDMYGVFFDRPLVYTEAPPRADQLYSPSMSFWTMEAATGSIATLYPQQYGVPLALQHSAVTVSSVSIDHRGMMSNVVIQKQQCQTELPLTSVVLDTNQHIYGYCTLTRTIYKYKIIRVEGHQLGPGFLYLSADQQCLASIAKDGFVQLRDVNSMALQFETQCHSHYSGGVKSIVLSLDCQTILTTGFHDGTLVCNTERLDTAGSERTKEVLDFNQSMISTLDQSCITEDKILIVFELRKDDHSSKDKLDIASATSYFSSGTQSIVSVSSHSIQSFSSSIRSIQKIDDYRSLESTWLETRMAEAIEKDNRKHSEAKAKLKQGIKKLRRTIKRMMLENESVPEIERLDQHEFNLDQKEQKRLHGEGEEKVAKVRETIEMENLANQYLCEVIKRECWDKMAVKGRTLEAFFSGLAVTNYPMRERSNDELELLRKIIQQRTIELIDLKARKDIVETPPKKDEKEDEEAEDEDSKEEENTALKGSLTCQCGVVNHYLYKQLDLHTKDEKINQIVLLQDVIYNIKTAFNKEFDATFKQKEVEISRVKDRTMRIKEIMHRLDVDEEVWLPMMSNKEMPEREFEVQDSEITAERYLTPEQKRKLEEEYKAEQLRLLAAKADNWRERALKDMMGGVLETKKSDILKMEIPVPSFMDKAEYEWTEEQAKQAKEYAIKEQELNEEKDKYRKTLESELKKLQGSIAESTSNFDDTMNKLFEKKVRTEMIIYQEELKICNLVFSLRIEEEILIRDAQLNYLLAEQKDFMVLKSQMTQSTKVTVDRFRETYDDLVAEDRLLDRGFRKEFSDVSASMVDQLYKLYKRRPKVQMQRIQVATANPFDDQLQSVDDGHTKFLAAMEELDSIDFKPETLNPAIWDRFCDSRRKKIESEHQVKLKAVTLAEMQMFLQRRMEEDDYSGQFINNLTQELNNLREIKSQFQLNLMVQLVLKQGQVEVLSSDFIPDYSNSILLHKGVVEDLNSTIQFLGERKVASMVERKDFRKKIVQVEWECQKMLMQMDDLRNKIRDILKLRITKQAQMYLSEANYENQINANIMGMERSVEGQEKFHSKVVKKKQETIKQLEKQIAQLKREIKVIDQQLKEQHISFSERQNIQEMTIRSDQDARIRFRDLMQYNKLMELSRTQAEDIAILRNELERQRMKTFPILAEAEQYVYN